MAYHYHVHEILEMLAISNKSYSRENLASEIKEKFGEQACFVNCADQELGVKEVIEFIIAKKKVEEKDGLIKWIASSCSH